MALPIRIVGAGFGFEARVTGAGELVVAALFYDDTATQELSIINTAFNLFPPIAGKQLVIKLIRLKANRDVSNTVDTQVDIYEASSLTSTVIDRVLFRDNMVRGNNTSLTGLNILVNEGKWVNAKTGDNDIFCTLMGYYIDAV